MSVHVDGLGAKGDGETNDARAIQDAINLALWIEPDRRMGMIGFREGATYMVATENADKEENSDEH